MAVMDVVVPCDCGSQFGFAVEPVNARLPEGAELLCPSCGKDGVPLANRVIGDNLRKQARELAAAQPPEPLKKSWGRRAKAPEKKEDPAPYSYPASDPFSEAKARGDDVYYAGPNKLKGLIGALLGGLIGAAIWAAVVHFTGYEIKYVAIGVGALTGLGSRLVGGGRDYHLGLFAAACAFVAILGGQYMAAKIYISGAGSLEYAEMEYEFKVEQAQEAAELKTDDEFKEFIAASRSTYLKPVAPESITAKVVADFKAKELPALQKLASGGENKTAFIEQERKALLAKTTTRDIFLTGFSPYLLFWVFAGVAAAWKLASDYGTSVE